MSQITELDTYRSHICMPAVDGNVYVLPVGLIEDIISGRKSINEVDNANVIVRTVFKNWLNDLIGGGNE